MNELQVNADREMLEQCIILSLLVNGRTTLNSFSKTESTENLLKDLEAFGLSYKEVGSSLVLEGKGLQYKIPTILPGEHSKNAMILLFALASRDENTRYALFYKSKDLLKRDKKLLTQIAKAFIEEESETSLAFHFPNTFILKKEHYESLYYLERNFALLSALVKGDELFFEEKTVLKDSFTSMLVYFGANIQYELYAPEAKTELERRLLKAKGMKSERSFKTHLKETKILTAREYFVPGDSTEALALTLTVLLSGALTKETLIIPNVAISQTRTSSFGMLKRMGADIEISSRRERYKEPYANIQIKGLKDKRLQGGHFSGDSTGGSIEEIPLLALAACFAEKETIFHLSEKDVEENKEMLETLTFNLRETGAEVGLYEEGLVIRGKEELDAGDFDCKEFPLIGLTLSVLTALLKVPVKIQNMESTEKIFPNIISQMNFICKKG